METIAIDHMITTDIPGPRISFSDEVAMFEETPYRSDSGQMDSTSDFDFCITSNETCLADELFSNGIIRPLQLQEKFINSKQFSTSKPPLPSPSPPPPPTDQSLKEGSIDQSDQKHQSKAPFWHLKRSSSLHYDHSSKKSSIWSSLSRSNSTGSVPNSKKLSKNSMAMTSPSSAKLCSQKPPLRKNSRGLSPVLNGPPPCIISVSTGNLFGLGTLFRNGKGKNIKK